MYEIRIKTEILEEANGIIKVIDEHEQAGEFEFDFSLFAPVNISDACCEAGAD